MLSEICNPQTMSERVSLIRLLFTFESRNAFAFCEFPLQHFDGNFLNLHGEVQSTLDYANPAVPETNLIAIST